MSNRERVVLYGLLAVLLAINVPALLGGLARPAHADGDAPDPAPVKSVTLDGAADEKDVVLRARKGRLAWSDTAHDRAYSTAYVFIGTVLNKLMETGTIEEEQQRLVDEISETEASYREQLEALGERLREMDPESPDAQRTYEEGQALYEEMLAWQREGIAERAKLDASHLEQSYRQMIEAVGVVAERRGIDVVYRFIPTAEPFEAENPDQAMMSIRLRTALRYPEELDITDDVLEELSLER